MQFVAKFNFILKISKDLGIISLFCLISRDLFYLFMLELRLLFRGLCCCYALEDEFINTIYKTLVNNNSHEQ